MCTKNRTSVPDSGKRSIAFQSFWISSSAFWRRIKDFPRMFQGVDVTAKSFKNNTSAEYFFTLQYYEIRHRVHKNG